MSFSDLLILATLNHTATILTKPQTVWPELHCGNYWVLQQQGRPCVHRQGLYKFYAFSTAFFSRTLFKDEILWQF